MFIIKSNLGYWNNSKGWIDDEDNAARYNKEDKTILGNLRYFYLDLKYAKFEKSA